MEFYIAQIISVLTAIVAILSMQMKSMKGVLITQISANLLAASTYFLLGGFSGAGISIIAIIQLIVMFLYNKKQKEPHIGVIILFILAYTIYSIVNLKEFIDIFPMLAAIIFSISVAQKNPSAYRWFGLIHPLCWLVYDTYMMAYINMLMRIGIFISAVVAKIRLDGLFNLKKKENDKEA